MTPWKADPEQCVILVVDIQPTFMAAIEDAERVRHRSEFLLKIAKLVGVPVLASEQYPERMGPTDRRIASLLPLGAAPHGKLCFSCAGCTDLMAALSHLPQALGWLVQAAWASRGWNGGQGGPVWATVKATEVTAYPA